MADATLREVGEEKPRVGERERTPVRSDLSVMYADGAAWSLMVGLGETYFAAFALALGKGAPAAALLATLPMFSGALAQWLLLPALLRCASLRRWVVLVVALQTLCFVPLLVGAWRGELSTALLFIIVSLYWMLGQSGGPAWSTWIEALVPRALRLRYFALRTRMLHATTLAGIAAGGFLLEEYADPRAPTRAFVLLFAAALLARAVSAVLLTRHSDGGLRPEQLARVPLGAFLGRLRHSPDGQLLAYLLALQLAIQLGQPLVTPFLLDHQQRSYSAYMGLVAAFFLGKAAAMPAWGECARRRGVMALLTLGGLGVIPATLPWLLTESYALLFLAQGLAGAFSGAVELATFYAYFSALDSRERASLLTHYNLLNSGAFAVGTLGGAWLLSASGGYAWAFAGSALLRALALLLLVRLHRSRLALKI